MQVDPSIYKAITESIREGIFTVDHEYRYTSFNSNHAAAMKRIYDVDVELGRQVFVYLSSNEEREILKEYLDRAFAGERVMVENKIANDPNGPSYLVVTHQPLRGQSGEIIGVCVIAGDITEPKAIVQRLKDSEERYRLLFRESPVGIVRYDENGFLINVNDKVTQIFGTTRDVLMKINPMRDLKNEDMKEAIRRSLEGKDGYFEGDYTSISTGEDFVLRMITRPIFSNGNVAGSIGIVEDITERSKAEQALRESEERFRMLFAESPIGIMRFDREGVLVDVNESLVNVFGSTREKLVGFDSVGRIRNKQMLKAITDAMEGKEGYFEGDYTSVTSGKRLVLRMITRPVYAFGVMSGGIAIVEDVTERVRAERTLRENEERFRLLFTQSPLGIVRYDNDGVLLEVNNSLVEVFGSTRERLVGFNSLTQVTNPGMLVAIRESLDGKEGHYEGEYTSITSGKHLILRMIARPVYDEGKVNGGIGIFEDVTDRIEAEEALKESEERYRSLVESSPVGVLVYNGKEVVFANPTSADWLGYESASDLIGISPMAFIHERERDAAMARVQAGLRREYEIKHEETRFYLRDGRMIDVDLSCVPINFRGESCIQATFSNITERKKLEHELQYMASHDGLTGLPNRVTLIDRLDHALEHAIRYRERLAVFFMDVNDFKLVNDTYGHEAGDQLLVELSRRLSDSVRGADTVARFAGDEFVILLENIGVPSHAEVVAKKILEAIEPPFQLGSWLHKVRISIGISIFPEDGIDGETLLHNADTAMYSAKNSTQHDYRFYIPEEDLKGYVSQSLEDGFGEFD